MTALFTSLKPVAATNPHEKDQKDNRDGKDKTLEFQYYRSSNRERSLFSFTR
jgi:hypothetical protein